VASRERVLRVLRYRGPVSRAQIARETALSRATVSSVVDELRCAGLVLEDLSAGDDRTSQTGRPPGRVRLNQRAGTALGIDFGKRHLRVVVADLGHRVLAERAQELDSEHRAEQGMTEAARLVDAVLAEAAVDRNSVIGAGLGLPGPVNQATGELGSSTILPGWVGVRAQTAMSQRLGLEVRVDNDANLGALGEWTWGAARGASNVAYLKVATGIGTGLIIDGRLYRGAGGTAGEIGHMIVDRQGAICRCGNRGCLETRVGALALVELLRPALGELTVREMLARARAGDLACRRVLADAGSAIGDAAATLSNLLNPERIVVGGELGAAGELLLGPLRAALRRAAIQSAAADAEVVEAELGERAEVLGAVALVLRSSGLAAERPDANAWPGETRDRTELATTTSGSGVT
jgi:predicted NBD/HSP70 family sugar kinase